MPVLRLVVFIFATLLLASLSALASTPDVATKSQHIQLSAAIFTAVDGEPQGPIAADLPVAADSVAEAGQSALATQTIPSVGENIP